MNKEAPMNYYDQHVHSSFSFDSQTELSYYMKPANIIIYTKYNVYWVV